MTTIRQILLRARSASVGAAVVVLAGCAQTTPTAGEVTVGATPPPEIQTPERAAAPPVQLRRGHPTRYTVVPGDTLWDISARFLRDPWRWPEVWRGNPDIRNPDLIYPGDELELYLEGGEPRVRLVALPPGQRPTVRLSPQIRVEEVRRPIPTVPYDAIAPFLKRGLVVTRGEWQSAPYVLAAGNGRIQAGTLDTFYARGAIFDSPAYGVFRTGTEYTRDRQSLGFYMEFVGDARADTPHDDPATFTLVLAEQEAVAGDRLFRAEDVVEEERFQFRLRPAPAGTDGAIIDVLNGEFLIGRYQSVVLDHGFVDGLEAGQVVEVLNRGHHATDPVTGERVRLPDERAGLIMVYKVFDYVSFGVVLEARRPIRPGDRVVHPEA